MKKKSFEMPTAYTVLFLIIMAVAVLTWIVPAGTYQVNPETGNFIAGTYEQIPRQPQGLWDVFMAPVKGMIGDANTGGAIDISLFILFIGGLLGIVNKTGAFDAGVASIIKSRKGKEKSLIPILMILFAIGGTTFGLAEETLAFFPILIPVMLAVGFDSIVAIAIPLIGSQIGCLASTVNPFSTGVASGMLDISPGEGLFSRFFLLIILLTVSIWYVYQYASKVEKDPSHSLLYEQRKEDLERFKINMNDIQDITKKQKQVLFLFVLTFVILVLGLVPWSAINAHWTFFESFTAWFVNIPILGAFFGKNMAPFGTWYFSEITMLMLVMSIVIAYFYGMSEKEFIQTFLEGTADFVGVAIVVAVAKGIQVVMNDGAITATILHLGEKGLENVSSSLFAILAYLFYIPMSFFIPSTSGLAAATMGIIGPMGEFSGVAKDVIITAYQAASGWANLITPTSAIVMGAVTIAHTDLRVWFKFVGKLMVIIFVVTVVYLGILAVL
ncbi:YfcC family protein [Enterococcus sp. LJL98]